MNNPSVVDKVERQRLTNKRNELIWALSEQEYSYSQMGVIFNVNKTTIMRAIQQKPSWWITPWVKRNN